MTKKKKATKTTTPETVEVTTNAVEPVGELPVSDETVETPNDSMPNDVKVKEGLFLYLKSKVEELRVANADLADEVADTVDNLSPDDDTVKVDDVKELADKVTDALNNFTPAEDKSSKSSKSSKKLGSKKSSSKKPKGTENSSKKGVETSDQYSVNLPPVAKFFPEKYKVEDEEIQGLLKVDTLIRVPITAFNNMDELYRFFEKGINSGYDYPIITACFWSERKIKQVNYAYAHDVPLEKDFTFPDDLDLMFCTAVGRKTSRFIIMSFYTDAVAYLLPEDLKPFDDRNPYTNEVFKVRIAVNDEFEFYIPENVLPVYEEFVAENKKNK